MHRRVWVVTELPLLRASLLHWVMATFGGCCVHELLPVFVRELAG